MWDPRELVLAPELTNPDYYEPAQWWSALPAVHSIAWFSYYSRGCKNICHKHQNVCQVTRTKYTKLYRLSLLYIVII